LAGLPAFVVGAEVVVAHPARPNKAHAKKILVAFANISWLLSLLMTYSIGDASLRS